MNEKQGIVLPSSILAATIIIVGGWYAVDQRRSQELTSIESRLSSIETKLNLSVDDRFRRRDFEIQMRPRDIEQQDHEQRIRSLEHPK